MTATQLPPGYGAMLHQFLHGWTPGKEWYWVQHKEIKPDGEEIWWKEIPVETITHLIRVLMSYPPSNNYLTATRYADNSPMHNRPIYTRGWMDFDLHDRDEVDTFNEFPRFRKVQDELRDNHGHSPIVIIFTGRGYHLWFYLDKSVSLEVATRIRTILTAQFDLHPDPKVPIEPHRQMRLPGFIHGGTKTPLYSVWCTERMSGQDFRQAAVEGTVRWDPVHPASPEYFLNFDPGETVIEEHLARQAMKTAPVRKVDLGLAEDVLLKTLAAQAVELREQGHSLDEIAVRLRRTRADINQLLR